MAKQSVNVLTLGKTPLTTILKLAWPTILEQMMFTVLYFYQLLYLVLGLSVTLLIIVILRCLIRPKRRKNAGGGQADSGKK